jgi:hypothetical protein
VTERRLYHSLAHRAKTTISRMAFIGASSALAFVAASHYRPAVADAQTRSGESRVEDTDYVLTLSTSGTYTAGKQGTATLKLVPKSPYKIDTTFPIKFILSDPPTEKSVTYTKKKLEAADGTIGDGAAIFAFNFTTATAGRATIGGKLHYRVCAVKCNTHNIDISLTVDVTAAPRP